MATAAALSEMMSFLPAKVQGWMGYLPFIAHNDADSLRHCRLIIGFGFMGGVFGVIYTAFMPRSGTFTELRLWPSAMSVSFRSPCY